MLNFLPGVLSDSDRWQPAHVWNVKSTWLECAIESRWKGWSSCQRVSKSINAFTTFSKTKLVLNACHLTTEKVSILLSMAAIPMTLKKHAIEKLEKLHASWLLLKKNKGRSSEAQRLREMDYAKKLRGAFNKFWAWLSWAIFLGGKVLQAWFTDSY